MKANKPKEKRGRGRPQRKIDWNTVDKLCAIQCTGEEIAELFDMDYDTLQRACKREKHTNFAEYFALKSQKGKRALRRKQMQLALDGNVTMNIWLGKQLLGQRDRAEVFNREQPFDDLIDEIQKRRRRALEAAQETEG